MSIFLHPKNFTDSNFSDSKFKSVDGSTFNFKIFNENLQGLVGFMIKEKACFEKLVAFLKTYSKAISAKAFINNQETQIPITGTIFFILILFKILYFIIYFVGIL